MKFLLAYLFWVFVLLMVAIGVWFTGSELSAFRYAGF